MASVDYVDYNDAMLWRLTSGFGRALTLVACLAVVPVRFTAGGEVPDPADPDLTLSERYEALVERISATQAELRTLEARFVQRKESPFLLEPEESRGSFAFAAPDRVRWDFTSPNDTVVVVRGEEMLTWYRDLGRAERVHVGRQADRLLQFLGPAASLDMLLRYFTLNASFPMTDGKPYRLELTPRISRLKKRIESITIHVDPRLFVPVYLRYAEPNGAATELHFEDLRVNGEIPDEHFEPTLPDDVEERRVEMGG